MIEVSSSKKKIRISGHALFDSKGNDLVCAAISAIVIGSINALESFNQKEITVKDGLVEIIINHPLTYEDKIRLRMLITEIKTVAQKYPNNITIKKIYNYL